MRANEELSCLTPLQELDEKIRMGWGNVRSEYIPEGWRTQRGLDKKLPLSHRLAIARAKTGTKKGDDGKYLRQPPGQMLAL